MARHKQAEVKAALDAFDPAPYVLEEVTPEAATAEQPPEAAQVEQAPAIPTIQVRTVFGPLVNPFSNVRYDQHWEDAQLPESGSWLDCQIQAGKMEKRG